MSRDQFAIRRTARGYTGPWQRPGCHNCQHAQPAGTGRYCGLWHFYTHVQGICPQYQASGTQPRADVGLNRKD